MNYIKNALYSILAAFVVFLVLSVGYVCITAIVVVDLLIKGFSNKNVTSDVNKMTGVINGLSETIKK